MSVFVSNFKPGDGTWTVMHDDAPDGSHSGSIAPTSISFGRGVDGGTDYRSILITCPVCGAVSTHPVGGGAQPPLVQEMFVRAIIRLGCPCGQMLAGRSPILTIAHARQHANATDFVGRWVIANILP